MTMLQFFHEMLRSIASGLIASIFLAWAAKGAYRVVFVAPISYLTAYVHCFAVFLLQSIAFALFLVFQIQSDAIGAAWFLLAAYVVPVAWWSRMLPRPDGTRAGVVRALFFGLAVATILIAAVVLGFGIYAALATQDVRERLAGLACVAMAAGVGGFLYWLFRRQRKAVRPLAANDAVAA